MKRLTFAITEDQSDKLIVLWTLQAGAYKHLDEILASADDTFTLLIDLRIRLKKRLHNVFQGIFNEIGVDGQYHSDAYKKGIDGDKLIIYVPDDDNKED